MVASSASRLDLLRGVLSGTQQAPYAHPLQRPYLYVPDLETHAWWSRDRFPWVAQLEAQARVIRAELEACSALFRSHPGEYWSAMHDQGDWQGMYFSFHGRIIDGARRACPKTAAIIESIPHNTGINFFSKLMPGTHIAPHFGITNLKLRCHLGLIVPPGCRMRVGDEVRSWKEGECLVFDDSFEHEVWHEGDLPRVVLSVDFAHPAVTAEEFEFLREAEASNDHRFQEHVQFWDKVFAVP